MTVLTIDLGNTRCKLRAWSVHDDGATRLAASQDFASASQSSQLTPSCPSIIRQRSTGRILARAGRSPRAEVPRGCWS